MATLMLSVGVPMMLGGDELSHGQKGNNNAYCQDNELNWLNWELDDRQKSFLEFTRKLVFIWRSQPVLQRRKFFLGRAIRGSDIKDISFFSPSGQEMSDEDWNAAFVRCMGVRLAGDLINDENERGEPIVGETLLILLNAHWEPIPFALPGTSEGHIWDRILDTADLSEEFKGFEGGACTRSRTVRWRSWPRARPRTRARRSRLPRPRPSWPSRRSGIQAAGTHADLSTPRGRPWTRTCSPTLCWHKPRKRSPPGCGCPNRRTGSSSTLASPSGTPWPSCRTCETWGSPTVMPHRT